MFPFRRKQKSTEQTPPLNWKWRLFRRVRMLFGRVVLLFLLILVIGLIPINNNFRPATDGVEVFVSSNGVHADVIVPIQTDLINWRDTFPDESFVGNTSGATHVAVGWGDKGFYVHTPRWADLKLSTAVNALFTPSPCCLHVVMQGKPKLNKNVHSVIISKEQYARMVQIIQSCYKVDKAGKPIFIPDSAYNKRDAFCEAHGNYHCLNTCNSWVGWVMRESGIKAPLLTPLPKSVFIYLAD